jgi:hypothetical protein
VKFAHISSVARHLAFDAIHVCDAEFSVHAPVAITLITSHRIAAASHPNYLKAGVHLLRANADVAPWLAALLAGCSSGASSAWAGVAAAAATLTVSVLCATSSFAGCRFPPPQPTRSYLQVNILLPNPSRHFPWLLSRIHVAPGLPLLLQV